MDKDNQSKIEKIIDELKSELHFYRDRDEEKIKYNLLIGKIQEMYDILYN